MKKDKTKCSPDEKCYQTCRKNRRILHHIVFFIIIFTTTITTVMITHHKIMSHEHPNLKQNRQDKPLNIQKYPNFIKNTEYNSLQVKKELLNTEKNNISTVREMQSILFQEALKTELEERMGEVYKERATQIVDAFISDVEQE